MEIIEFEGWPNCIRLSNGEIELIVTSDVGPRIIRCGFIRGRNLFHVSGKDRGKTGGSEWRIYGGHRLWHSPEVMPRTYFPDNGSVAYKWDGTTLRVTQPVEKSTGIIKEMEIILDKDRNNVTILHRLVNTNLWTIEASVWPVTAHAAGGRAVVPQEPYMDPAEYLLPARPVVLWYYTRMNDPRWTWGEKFIGMRFDASCHSEQKIGILNKQGWAAYISGEDIMIRRFDYEPGAKYEDYGCNNELYINGEFMEIETLGPVSKIIPGGCAEHTERWQLAKANGHEAASSEIGELLAGLSDF